MNRFVIAEPSLCIGCNTCMAACAQVHEAEGLVNHPRLMVVRDDHDRTAPVLCRQCEDAPCARVCPVNAITLTDGAVVLNESTCIGCKLCGLVCPFGAITPGASKPDAMPESFEHYVPATVLSNVPYSPPSMNPFLSWNTGERVIAVKCDLCSFRQEGPACVQSCPTKALYLIDELALERATEDKRRQAVLWFSDAQDASSLSQLHSGGKNG